MTLGTELSVIVDNGVLRPEGKMDLPEHTRLVIVIRRVETTPEGEAAGRAALHEIRQRGSILLGGWRPTREELHERG